MTQDEGAVDWRARARASGLLAREVEALARDGMVVIGQRVDPARIYRHEPGTIFVTTDTMIATFSALMRAGFVEIEQANAEYLRRAFVELLDQLAADRGSDERAELPGTAKEGFLAARVLVATTLFLLEHPIESLDLDTAAAARYELSLVRAARRAPPSAALSLGREPSSVEYGLCRPRGIYQRDPVLRGYFQAISWLQLTHIPLDSPQGRACGIALARALARSRSAAKHLDRMNEFVKAFVGSGAIEHGLSHLREAIGSDCLALEAGPGEAIRRTEAAAARAERTGAKEHAKSGSKAFRFFRQVEVPSTSVFEKLSFEARVRPSGLHLAAVLGSAFARRTAGTSSDSWSPSRDEGARKERLAGSSIHRRFLRCLSVLLEYEDRRLPAFMRTRSWQAKTCSTALCGWTWQMHLGGLWAEMSAMSGYTPDETPVGLVEPNPEFYRCLREVALQASDLLARNREQRSSLLKDGCANKSWQRVMQRSDRLSKTLLAGGWAWLISSLSDLERIARTQLDNRQLSKEDVLVFRRFGRGFDDAIGCAVLFVGRPLECVCGVFQVTPGPILHAGISHARPIWVLYPQNGRPVLCRGAVWLYHEFWESRTVDDEEWWDRLRSAEPPALPPWLGGIVQERP